MTAQTATLTDFLLARIAEDEDEPCHRWDCDKFNLYEYGTRQGDCDCGHPLRVLAECEAKRAIVAEHGFDFVAPVGAESSWEEFVSCRTCHGDVGEYPCPTLRALALPYADHPEFRPEWRA